MHSCLALLLALTFTVSTVCAASPADDPVLFTFATVGDCRHDPEALDITAQDRVWLQNSRVFARMLREIEAQKPHALFFNGDMIHGYSTNRHVLDRQYAYWRGMVAGMAERGVCVLPVPGNHEVQLKTKLPNGEVVKAAYEPSEVAWRENMADLILDTNRWLQAHHAAPTAWSVEHTPRIGEDGVQTDQRQLSYSFDFAGLHFAVINTDAVGADSHAPVTWLAADLAAAKSRGVKRQFVFGHKMGFTYHYSDRSKPKGFDVFPENQRAFWGAHGAIPSQLLLRTRAHLSLNAADGQERRPRVAGHRRRGRLALRGRAGREREPQRPAILVGLGEGAPERARGDGSLRLRRAPWPDARARSN